MSLELLAKMSEYVTMEKCIQHLLLFLSQLVTHAFDGFHKSSSNSPGMLDPV